jgi:hypothetical protein
MNEDAHRPNSHRKRKNLKGEALHYPTEEEIAALRQPQPARGNRVAKVLLLCLALFIGAIWVSTIITQEPPGAIDPIRERIQRRMMRPW